VYDAISHGKGNGLDVALGTNGRLLKRDKLEQILPALTYLRFNFSAGEPKRYAEIMGCKEEDFYEVVETIRKAIEVKNRNNLEVTIGLQMVLMPSFKDQIIPLAQLGKQLGVDYTVIKHCSDDEEGSLGVHYEEYFDPSLIEEIKKAEETSTDKYSVKAKWSKILSGGKRTYSQCYGPPFILQLSGSGLVAPCGMLFNDKYKEYHIGNIIETPFKKIWKSDRYWQVMDRLASDRFDARTDCGTLCLQHLVNGYLSNLKTGKVTLSEPRGEKPLHVNFI
jgi:MoaA/NifB/PqqE/SkfB family radical SAM enzyme